MAAAADVVFNSSLSPFSCAGAFVYFCISACVCDCGGFFSSLDPFCCRFRQLVKMLLLHSNYIYIRYIECQKAIFWNIVAVVSTVGISWAKKDRQPAREKKHKRTNRTKWNVESSWIENRIRMEFYCGSTRISVCADIHTRTHSPFVPIKWAKQTR